MKILELRFKNLNSLIGEWLIDFTADEYLCDGIFAITGATGTGKTTILDAICLALYGETPRLGKITKSNNEIMSKQCSECFSEICFSTKEGNFRCTWSQHRSRRKADGELQAPKHEISNATTGEILEAKIKDVSNLIISKIGMDFKQFTRSILLAQGGFAAFLNAKAEERAPILEQITGTEIYSSISLKVHERRNEEQRKLDLLAAELTSINLLDEATIKNKTSILENQLKEAFKTQEEITDTNKSISSLERSFEIKNKLANLENSSISCAEKIQKTISAEIKNINSRINLNKRISSLNKHDICSHREKLNELINYLNDNSHDEELVSEFTAIKESLNRYLLMAKDKELKNNYINKLETELTEHRRLYGEANIHLKDLSTEKDKLSEMISLKDLEYTSFLKENLLLKNAAVIFNQEKINLHKVNEESKVKLLQSIEEERILLSKIFSLEAERKNLEDSKPCPLCGSLEHPFAQGNLVSETELDKKSNAIKNDIKVLRETILALELDKRSFEKDIEHTQKELKLYSIDCELILEEKTYEGIANPKRNEEISKLLEKLQIELEKLKSLKNEVLERIEKENKKLESLKDDGLKIKNSLETEKQFYSKILENINSEGEKIKERIRTFIKNEISLSENEISRIQTELENKLKAFEKHTKLKAETLLLIEKLEQEQIKIQENTSELHLQLDEISKASGKNLSQESSEELASQIKAHEENQITSIHETLSELKSKLENLRTDFKQVSLSKQELEKESYSLEGSIHSLRLNLEELIIPNETLENLNIKRESLLVKQQKLLEEIGSIKKELEDDKAAKGKEQEKLNNIKSQEKELERFNKLHMLIGSSDGNKYRKFVQGLSFQTVISYANKQLQEMSDRYILCMDSDQALELNVIDNYQAAEIRSTKNLSGGESFIISLALALGLSKIVSSNIRVDSLFLDEGFGTLDAEALEVALETLSNLKQSGKLIGIISHMEALKERIPTQIKVESISGGRSILSGAGCRKLF